MREEERQGAGEGGKKRMGKARKLGGTHFKAHAYLSQQPNKAGPQRKKI